MTYKCGHESVPHIIEKNDFTLVSQYSTWLFGKQEACFQCYRDVCSSRVSTVRG